MTPANAIPFFHRFIQTCSAKYSHTEGDYSCIIHAHTHYEIVYVQTPTHLRHTLGGYMEETHTPCIVFRAPYMLHTTETIAPGVYHRYVVDIHPCMFTKYGGICSLRHLAGVAGILIPTTAEQMDALIPLLDRLVAQGFGGDQRITVAALTLLLAETAALLPSAHPLPPPTPEYIQEVLSYIVDNIGEPLSIPALAEHFFCSPSKLSRDFRAVTSLTIHEYIIETRMAFARLWLSEGLPVSLVATRCGFSDASAFIRAFRGRYGETPGKMLGSL